MMNFKRKYIKLVSIIKKILLNKNSRLFMKAKLKLKINNLN